MDKDYTVICSGTSASAQNYPKFFRAPKNAHKNHPNVLRPHGISALARALLNIYIHYIHN